jgi:putative membrane protein
MNESYHIWGIHLVYWSLAGMFIFWIFAIPRYLSFQQKKRGPDLDILNKRLASGEIQINEYLEKKKKLKNIKPIKSQPIKP